MFLVYLSFSLITHYSVHKETLYTFIWQLYLQVTLSVKILTKTYDEIKKIWHIFIEKLQNKVVKISSISTGYNEKLLPL